MEFKVGDMVRMTRSCSGLKKGDVCVLVTRTELGIKTLYAEKQGKMCCCNLLWEPVSKTTKPKKQVKFSLAMSGVDPDMWNIKSIALQEKDTYVVTMVRKS